MSVRVVTDSAATCPQRWSTRCGIEIVPLTIRFGDEELVDREELSTDEFWQRLERSTCCPRPRRRRRRVRGEFRELVDDGATGIVCINLSSQLSATMQAAQVAADGAARRRARSQVIDSLSVSMGLGNLCLTAARRAADGDSLESIVARGRRPARPHQAVRRPSTRSST